MGFVRDGSNFQYTVAGSDIAVDEGRIVGERFGIALQAGAIGEEVEMQRKGLWELPKNASFSPAIGDLAFWDDATNEVRGTTAGRRLIGTIEKIPTSTTCWVMLDDVARNVV